MARTLDKSRDFGTIHGGGELAYEQDGCYFNIQGEQVGDEPAEQPKKRGPKPQVSSELDAQIEANLKG